MADINSSSLKIDKSTLNLLERMDPVEIERFAEAGPEYFCPLLGDSNRQTFDNIGYAAGLLTAIIENGLTVEHSRGAALLAQTIWTAAQFSAARYEVRPLSDAVMQ